MDNTLASTGAETTTTCYGAAISGDTCNDDGYHTYALWQKDALGHETQTAYELTKGVPIQVTDQNHNVTTATYDVYGRLLTVVRPGDSTNSPTIQVTYNSPNLTANPPTPFWTQASQKIDASNSLTVRKFYDGTGELIQSQTAGALVNGTTQDIIVDYRYDIYGRLASQSEPYSITPGSGYHTPNGQYFTTTAYDVLDRPTSVTAPDGSVTSSAYSIVTGSTPGFETDRTDANNHMTKTITDMWGNTVQVIPPSGSGSGPSMSYGYDVAGHLLTATRGSGSYARITTYTYDIGGRVVSMDDADMHYLDYVNGWQIYIYTYDALGNLVSQGEPNSQMVCQYYDALNRMTGKQYENNSACPATLPPTPTIKYGYDETGHGNSIGQRTSMTDASGSTNWYYSDSLGRGLLSQETKLVNNPGGGTFNTSWTYNSADQVASITYPGWNNGAAGELLQTSYTPQMMVNSVSATGQTYVQSTSYDAAGRPLTRVLVTNVLQTGYTYFAWNQQGEGGRLDTIKSGADLNNPSLQFLQYVYDPVGNIVAIDDYKAGNPPQVQEFTYDPLNRLATAVAIAGNGGSYNTETYTYDPNRGTLSSKAGITYTYGDSNHVDAVTNTSDGRTFAYDGNGNMVTRVIGGVTYTLTYDAENHLTGVTSSNNSVTATFVYDGDGNRVKAVITQASNTTRTTFIGNYLEWTTVGTNILRNYYYYAGGTRIAGRHYDSNLGTNTLYWLLSDQLGSTTITANQNGSFNSELRYKAWGDQRYASGTTPTNDQFTGQYAQPEIGLDYYNARWYDRSLGRWTQPDTVVQNPYDPQDWDRYEYVHNSPVVYNDPTGHCLPFCIIIAIAVIAAIIIPWVSSDTAPVGQTYKPETPEQFSADVSQRLDASATILSTGLIVGGATQALSSGIGETTNPNNGNNPNQIGAWGEQQVGENLPVNIQQQRVFDPVTGQMRIYDGNFNSNPDAFVEVKTSTQGVVYATQRIQNQIEFRF